MLDTQQYSLEHMGVIVDVPTATQIILGLVEDIEKCLSLRF